VSEFILLIERILSKISDMIICVSDSLRDMALKKYRLAPDSKVSVIYYGLNSAFTNPQLSSEKKSNKFTFGIVGRLVPIKGHELFLESAKLLLENTATGHSLQFKIVGDGPEREGIKDMAHRLGIEKNVVFAGWRRNSIYDDIDVLCVTSKNEGVPFVILEALLFKRPAIAVDSGGIRDIFTIVKDNGAFYVCKEGLLVKERKSKAIMEAMNFLLNNNQLCYEMGNEGHRKIKENFSAEKMLYQLNELFRKTAKIQ
jgi:glycosyltransferase involved in cell wall biosynthesis